MILREEALAMRGVEEDEPEVPELTPELAEAIGALPLEDRVILGHAIRGASQREIGRLVGMAQPSVCHRLGRAIVDVRRRLRGEKPLKRIRARVRIAGVVKPSAGTT